ncbi:hypothetical protein EST38_g11427 [Candolleomyces aberdarensis]|uniref:GCM domain-containing protein n=1 Tax=Candolleomyces aberdarensis TaxID=2316362 RepID=A0A4Q2D7L0_9AGAR|nr:hypothetical protein EST38_g11427 [Candolleomyces aberdarensis]
MPAAISPVPATNPGNTGAGAVSSPPNNEVRRPSESATEPVDDFGINWPNGNRFHHGLTAEVRRCLGVIVCTNNNCGRHTRPRTQTAARKLQISKNCSLCSSPLHEIRCQCRTYRYRTILNDQPAMIWEHVGHHQHPRPPPPSVLNSQQLALLDEQVARNPNATVHQLRTGTLGPGSVPLHEISETLTNPRAARHQVAQSQNRLGIPTSSSQKGGFAFMGGLVQLNEEEQFVVDSSIGGPVYITFQTDFMRQVLKEAMEEWAKDNSRSERRHGIVTDGSHSYFRDGQLLTSCVFSPVTLSWIPIQFSWIYGKDTDHHIPHFERLGKYIVNAMGPKFECKHLLHVMDFSLAQRKAHAIAYATAVIESLGPLFNQLDPKVQEQQRQALIREAESMEVGCDLHYERSLLRVRNTAAIVPSDHGSRFDDLVQILRGRNTTEDEFDRTVKILTKEFPRLKSWIEWWTLQPGVASMIFPAKSSVDPNIRQQVPSTSNAVEHQHSLLNHASGSLHDLLPGATLLLKHVKEREAQYKAIKNGIYDPHPPQKSRPPKQKVFENDGRAPDTVEALKKPGVAPVSDLDLMSYAWLSPNSCFWDSSFELWYRAFSRWSPTKQQEFLQVLPSNSFLSAAFYHFTRRSKVVAQSRGVITQESTRKMVQELSLGQMLVKRHIFDVWELYFKNEQGCTVTWLQSAAQPLTVLDIEMSAATALQSRYGSHIKPTASHYFENYIPRNRANGNRPVHLHPTSRECNHAGCGEPSDVRYVTVSWPLVLNCRPATVTDPNSTTVFPVDLTWPPSFTIRGEDGRDEVTYELVGRVLHSGNHFTSEILIDGRPFHYNDMDCDGSGGYAALRASDNENLLQETSRSRVPQLYVYLRTSDKAMVCLPFI